MLCCSKCLTSKKKKQTNKNQGKKAVKTAKSLMVVFGVFGILRTEIALLLRCTYNKGYLAMAS